ncbi:mitochondrial putative glutamate--tRNA ligase [Diplogelasinospora grovesii]|uniref:Glutamate--tRNA ligase, mitochondrial n=1 Tax=Diplogelasinospora grovesii TaxID=303347 RepID=A0AAN6N9S0_9PEZI|nr:mitochondrial putative glutamate--tRNA ligase [Diplogelasinospora grovesii]
MRRDGRQCNPTFVHRIAIPKEEAMRGLRLPRRSVCSEWARLRSIVAPTRHLKRFLSDGANLGEKQTLRRHTKNSRRLLPETACRTRFAPSPTGYLHLGSLRTALFNFLLAKATGGQFILRIEDTDQTRIVQDAEKRLYEDLHWAGLSWDEGPDVSGPYGPYRQSERLRLYDEHAEHLIHSGKAYRCFCSPEDVEAHKRRAHETGGSTHYPGTCRNISPEESDERAHRGEKFAVRFKSNSDRENTATIQDIVYGRYRKAEIEEDFIIRKRDGFPTYHFANIVDDRFMKITHVIRGAEWLISTPKHVELYNAFGWEPPQFAHVGLLVDNKRQKLSKRHQGTDMTWYRNRQVLPDALLNFAVLLGWNRTNSKEDVMSLQEMIDSFSLKFSKGDIIVSFDKLPYLQSKHLQRLINTDPPAQNLFSRYLTPIENIINRVEHVRLGNNITSQGTISPDSISKPVVPTTPGVSGSQLQGHILDVLRINKVPETQIIATPSRKDVLEGFVTQNKYLFWGIPEHVFEERFKDLDINTEKISLADRIEHVTPTEVVHFFLDTLEEVPDNLWTTEHLRGLAENAASNFITYADGNETRNKSAGYKFLRWALMGGDHGPALAAVMKLLGREETMFRLESAARSLEASKDRR